MTLSPKTKTQILRIVRIGGLGLIGGAFPIIAGMHGNLTLVGIEAAVVAGGEGLYRSLFPVVEEALANPSPRVITKHVVHETPAPIPPAVY